MKTFVARDKNSP